MTESEIRTQYDDIVSHLRDAQQGIQALFREESQGAAIRAAYESALKLDEAFMWLGNAVSCLKLKSDEAIEKAVDEKLKTGDLKVL